MNNIKLFKDNIKINTKGNVYKFIEINKIFPKISEVYFSKIKKKNIKAWKKNKTSNQFFYIIEGSIILKIFDDRKKKNKTYEYRLGNKLKFSKVLIPKNVWYGFKGLSKNNTIVNALGKLHRNCKMLSLKLKNKQIPINWK